MTEWSKRYLYDESNVARFPPVTGGVYRLSFQGASYEEYIVFYVGKSENLGRRLGEHLSFSEVDDCIREHLCDCTCYFRFIKINSETQRDRVEQSQIRKYKPTCND